MTDTRRSPLAARPVAAAVAALALVGLVVLPGAVGADALTSDARTKRDQVRSEKAAVAAEVDALQGDEAQVAAALAALNENVRGQQAAYADAKRRADDAQRQADDAAAAVEAKQAEIVALKEAIAEFAVNAYIKPPTESFLDGFREDSAGAAARKKELLSYRTGHDADLLDQLRSAQSALDAAQREADDARDAADEQLGAVSAQLTQLQVAQAQQQQYANQVESRLDAKLAEAANLSTADAALSAEISKQEAALAAQLRAAPGPQGGGSGSGGGGGSGGTITQVPGPPGLTTVGGITVNSSIASNLQNLLSAASAAGISLGGSGYRDSAGQIALRRQNCGSSDYAIYQMPASQCSPETARPGLSKHEQGLAVDFTTGGGALRYGSPAHQWMVANAGSYGWVPLAGEPWHWSVGGG